MTARASLPGLKSQRDSQTRPHRRAAPSTKPRGGRLPRPARASPCDLWGFARIYVCPRRRVWLPRPHPRRVTCGTEAGDLTDVPVRFDRRSIIVKSKPFLSSSLIRMDERVFVCVCVWVVDDDRPTGRPIDRIVPEDPRVVERIFSLSVSRSISRCVVPFWV